jgi:hypothetical protein
MVCRLGWVGLTIAAAILLCSSETRVLAGEWHRHAKSGQPADIGFFWDCKTHIPLDFTSFIEHGTISFRDSFKNRCGNAQEPVKEIYYTSTPGFKGNDTAIFPNGQRYRSIFYIVVE